jgi:hypothetical protein
LAISVYNPSWLDKVKLGYQDDPIAVKLLAELASPTAAADVGAFTCKDGILRHKGRIWLRSNKLAH